MTYSINSFGRSKILIKTIINTDRLSVDAQNDFFRHLSLSIFTWVGAVRTWYYKCKLSHNLPERPVSALQSPDTFREELSHFIT